MRYCLKEIFEEYRFERAEGRLVITLDIFRYDPSTRKFSAILDNSIHGFNLITGRFDDGRAAGSALVMRYYQAGREYEYSGMIEKAKKDVVIRLDRGPDPVTLKAKAKNGKAREISSIAELV